MPSNLNLAFFTDTLGSLTLFSKDGIKILSFTLTFKFGINFALVLFLLVLTDIQGKNNVLCFSNNWFTEECSPKNYGLHVLLQVFT